jgi:hypothetical protein
VLDRRHLIGFVSIVGHFPFAFSPKLDQAADGAMRLISFQI